MVLIIIGPFWARILAVQNCPVSLPTLLRRHLHLPMITTPVFLVSGPRLILTYYHGNIINDFPTLGRHRDDKFGT